MSARHRRPEGDAGRPRRVEPQDGRGELPRPLAPCPPPPCILWTPSPPAAPGHSLHDLPQFIGQTGTVHRITDRGDVRVQFSHETRWTFHPRALIKVHGGLGRAPSPPHPLHVPAQPRRSGEGWWGPVPWSRDPGVAGYRRARRASHRQLGPVGQAPEPPGAGGGPVGKRRGQAGRLGLFSNAPSGEGVGRPVRAGGCSGLGERHFGSRVSQMRNGGGRSVRSRG